MRYLLFTWRLDRASDISGSLHLGEIEILSCISICKMGVITFYLYLDFFSSAIELICCPSKRKRVVSVSVWKCRTAPDKTRIMISYSISGQKITISLFPRSLNVT